jgi:hypothetical protein
MSDSEYALRRAIDIERTAVATGWLEHRRQRYGWRAHTPGLVPVPAWWGGHGYLLQCHVCRDFREELAGWTELQYAGLGR